MAIAKSSPNGVAAFHPDYAKYAKKWRRCRDVIGGQDDIYEGGVLYLPKLIDEQPTEYKARLQRTPFFNGSWRTVAGFVGMLLKKAPILEVPEQLKKFLEDVTLSGVTFDGLVKEVLTEDFIVTRVGVFVDHPPLVPGLSVAEAEARGQRPTMTLYQAETIRNWRYEYRGNKKTLVQVRLSEMQSQAVGEFGEQELAVIRVLDLDEAGFYRQRVYDEKTGVQIGVDVYPVKRGAKMTEIPFYPIGSGGNEGQLEDPEMIDLFDLNIKHFQASADYVHACHMTALPTPWVTGYTAGIDMNTGQPEKTTFRIGSTTAWVFPDHQTKVGFLEYEGGGIDALEKMVLGYERQMAAVGARMLAPEKSGVEAADTVAMRHSGEDSVLASVAGSVSEAMTKALNMFSDWCGFSTDCKYEINKKYMPVVASPQQVTSWLAAVQAGRMSAEVFFWNMQRADQIPEDRTFAEEQAAIDADPIPRPVPSGHEGPADIAAREDEEKKEKEGKLVDKPKAGD